MNGFCMGNEINVSILCGPPCRYSPIVTPEKGSIQQKRSQAKYHDDEVQHEFQKVKRDENYQQARIYIPGHMPI